MDKYTVAVVQMNSSDNKADNLEKIEKMINQAVSNKAQLVIFPEMVNIMTSRCPYYQISESLEGPTVSFFTSMAKKYAIWICCGSFFESIKDSKKVYNTSILLSDTGDIKAIYRKRHMFDIDLENGKSFRESDRVEAGDTIITLDSPLGKLGISICYDLRFPEQFRQMTKEGMQVLLLPASFVDETGRAHWETLIRARAIENGCYVLASDQCGQKDNHTTHGNSMIVNPWGEIIARAGISEEVLFAEIDLGYVDRVRKQIPSTICISEQS